MKITYRIRQEIGYYYVEFYADNEAEMTSIVKTLAKGNAIDKADKYRVIVTVDYSFEDAEAKPEEDDNF